MEDTNVDDLEKVEGQEEETTIEGEGEDANVDDLLEDEDDDEAVITLPKKRFKAIQRKAIAYDMGAKPKKQLSTKKVEPIGEEVVQTVRSLKIAEDKRQFGFENNLSPQETDYVFKFANGKPTKEVLNNPFVKAGIEGLRATKRIEDNTPSSNHRSPVFQGKEFKDMDEEERRKRYNEAGKRFQRV